MGVRDFPSPWRIPSGKDTLVLVVGKLTGEAEVSGNVGKKPKALTVLFAAGVSTPTSIQK